MKVFVYGTLKSGGRLNGALSSSKLLGDALTVENYKLTNCGFPFMIDDGERKHPVKGELWEIDEITRNRLDGIEGEGHLYHRKVIPVKNLQTDETVETYAYIACKGRGDNYPECNILKNDTIGTYYWY